MGMGHGGGSGGGGAFITGHRNRALMGGMMAMPGMPGMPNMPGMAAIATTNMWGAKIMGIAIPFKTVLGTATTTSGSKLDENINRRYLLIQNIDSSDDLHIGFDGSATTSTLKIEPGNAYEPIMVPTSAIHIRTDSNTAKFVIIHG